MLERSRALVLGRSGDRSRLRRAQPGVQRRYLRLGRVLLRSAARRRVHASRVGRRVRRTERPDRALVLGRADPGSRLHGPGPNLPGEHVRNWRLLLPLMIMAACSDPNPGSLRVRLLDLLSATEAAPRPQELLQIASYDVIADQLCAIAADDSASPLAR